MNQHATQPSLSTSSSLFTFSDLSRFSSGFSDTVKLILNFSRCSRFHKSNIIPTGKSTLPPSLPKAPLGSADWIAAFLLAEAALFIVRAHCLVTAAASEEDTKLFHSPCTGVPLPEPLNDHKHWIYHHSLMILVLTYRYGQKTMAQNYVLSRPGEAIPRKKLPPFGNF